MRTRAYELKIRRRGNPQESCLSFAFINNKMWLARRVIKSFAFFTGVVGVS
jgi:hypothetical protein